MPGWRLDEDSITTPGHILSKCGQRVLTDTALRHYTPGRCVASETIIPRGVRRRANRAIQFVEKLPFLLEQKGPRLILVIGSSGVLRSFSPSVFDALAAEAGAPTRAVNIGLPAISCEA